MWGRPDSLDLWGIVDRVEGYFEVGTKVIALGTFPLIPVGSYLCAADGSRLRIPLSLKSCAVAYVRTMLGFLSFGYSAGGALGLIVPVRLPGLGFTLIGLFLAYLAWGVDRHVPGIGRASYSRAKSLLARLDAPPRAECALALRFERPLPDHCGEPTERELNALRAFELTGFAAASRPTLVRLSTWRYLRASGKWPKGPMATVGLCLGAAVLGGTIWHSAFWLLIWPAALVAYLNWPGAMWARRALWGGDLCPGVVVGEDPGRVAVITDLTTGADPFDYPVVKVIECRLSSLALPAKPGDRVPMGALYGGGPGSNHWDDFDPIPVAWGTANPEVICRSIARIPEENWQQLEIALTQLPLAAPPGLYTVDLGDAGESDCGWRQYEGWVPGTALETE